MDSAKKKCFPWKGENKVFIIGKATDVNGNELNLYKGTYEMAECSFSVMVKKGHHLKIDSYDLLRGFCHENFIEPIDFFVDDEKMGCFVIPEVDVPFKTWFHDVGKDLLFNQSGHMSQLLKSIIIQYSSLVEKLIRKKLIIENIGMGDLYISPASSKLRILLTQVNQVKVLSAADQIKNWNHIRALVAWCEKNCKVKLDPLTESFCNYIGKSGFKLLNMNDYPHDWGETKKGSFLMSLAAANHDDMRRLLRVAEIDWPYQKEHRVFQNLPTLLCKILDWEENVNYRKYNMLDAMSYIILLRNLYKHYDELPEEIKVDLVNRKSVVEVIEKWSPGIWLKIYEVTGWP